MANLSDQLNDVNSSARAIDAPGSAGSGLSTALSAIGKGLGAFDDMARQRAQAKRQAASDAREQWRFDRDVEKYDANNAAARAKGALDDVTTNGISTPVYADAPTQAVSSFADFEDGAASQVDGAAGEIKRYKIGVEQKKLPPMAINGMANKLFNQILNDNPKIGPGALAAAFKERGIDLFHAYEEQVTDQAAIEKTKRDERDAAYKAGAAITPLATMLEMTDDEIVNAGRIHIRDQQLLDTQLKLAQEQRAAQSSSQSTINFNKSQINDDVVGVAIQRFTSAVEPTMQKWAQYSGVAAPERGSNAGYETQRAKVESELPRYFGTVVNQIVNDVTVNYGAEAGSKVRTALEQNVKSQYSDPIAASGESWARANTVIQNSFGIRMRESAPLVYQMKSLGLDVNQIPDLMSALPQEVTARVGQQMRGILSDGLVSSTEKAQVATAIAVLKGEANINEIDSASARRTIMQTSANYVRANAVKVAQGTGDPEGYMSFARQTALGAVGINRQSGTAAIVKATDILSHNGAVAAGAKLRGSADTREEAELLGSAQRAAAAQLLTSAKAALQGTLTSGDDKYQMLYFNEQNGQFEFRFNDQAWRRANRAGNRGSAMGVGINYGGGFDGTKAPPSREAQQLLGALNKNLTFLVRSNSWDKDSPTGTEREVAAFWATGKPTGDMQKKAIASKKSGTSMDIGNSLLNDLTQVPDMSTIPTGNEDIIGPEGTGKNPRSSAQGVGQFTNETWISTLRKHSPQTVEGLSDERILAMRSNRELASKAVGWYRADNAAYLAGQGLPSGRTATALAHFAGPQGAANLLKADPNTPAEEVLGQAAIRSNPHLRGKTASQVLEWARSFYRAG